MITKFPRITYIVFTCGLVLTSFWVAAPGADTSYRAGVKRVLSHGDARTLALVHFKGSELLRIVFDTALEFARVDDPSPHGLNRAEEILQLHVALDPNETLTPDLAGALVSTTNAILRLPLSERTRANILFEMDAFDLWRPEHAWFLAARASSEEGLRMVELSIDRLAENASATVRRELGEGVRRIQPYTPRALATLHRLRELDPTDLVALFLYAAHELDRTVASSAEARAATPNRYPDETFGHALNELRIALREGRADVADAFARARKIMPRSKFFAILHAPEFAWTERRGWRHLALRPDAGLSSSAKILAFVPPCGARLTP